MDIIDELRNHLALYYAEMQRCRRGQMLLCASCICYSRNARRVPHRLNHRTLGGSRYVDWCNAYMPGGGAIAGRLDWYQMQRNAAFS